MADSIFEQPSGMQAQFGDLQTMNQINSATGGNNAGQGPIDSPPAPTFGGSPGVYGSVGMTTNPGGPPSVIFDNVRPGGPDIISTPSGIDQISGV